MLEGEGLLERIAKQSAEVEVALLGLSLIDPLSFATFNESLEPTDLLNSNHQRIFEAVKRVFEETGKVDLYLIANLLKVNGFLESIGGIEALNFLMANAGYRENAKSYIEEVIKASTKSRLVRELGSAYQGLLGEGDHLEVIEGLTSGLFELTGRYSQSSYRAISQVAKEVIEGIERVGDGVPFTGLETGFTLLDRYTLGLQEGDFIIIAARPSMGKTAFALNLAANICQAARRRVLLFSLEMTSSQLLHRFLSNITRINSFKIRSANLTQGEWSKIYRAQDQLSNWELYLNDKAGIRLEEIITISRALHKQAKLDLIIIDYLQLLSLGPSSDYEGRQFEVSRISRALKHLARELKVPLIALSQLSRQVEKREDKIPIMSDLRESGTIEQDADLILFLHRPDYYKKEQPRGGVNKTNLIVSKNRNGPTGFLELQFLPEFGSFEESYYQTLESPPGLEVHSEE